MTDIRTEVLTLRIDTRGHRALRTKMDFIKDENYTDKWGRHEYTAEWTMITGGFLAHFLDGEPLSLSGNFDQPSSCAVCDEYMGYELSEDHTTAISKTACEYPNGVGLTVVEIDIPSGKLICDDDLRDVELFDFDIDKGAGYNSDLGQSQVITECAKVGLAYGPCGNTMPRLFEIELGKYAVGKAGYAEDTDEEIDPPGNVIASFCTDLWAFSMADYDLWLELGGEPVPEGSGKWDRTVVDVPPGRYRMTYYGHDRTIDRDDYTNETIYATFERIGN